jgi:hypothetical protein
MWSMSLFYTRITLHTVLVSIGRHSQSQWARVSPFSYTNKFLNCSVCGLVYYIKKGAFNVSIKCALKSIFVCISIKVQTCRPSFNNRQYWYTVTISHQNNYYLPKKPLRISMLSTFYFYIRFWRSLNYFM